MRAVVVGGGLAGIAAALKCADTGHDVTLYENRPRLGGLAFSFRRSGAAGELSIDNGQHVFLRCCDAYRGLLARLGVTDKTFLQPRLDVPVLRPDGKRARLRRTAGTPAPAHLSAALLRYGLLSPPDRLRAIRAAVALRLLDPADRSLDEQTLGDFLRRNGQNKATIDALWGVLATATLNIDPDAASLSLAATVFRTGVLDRAAAGDIGHATAPLGELHDEAARTALAGAGVDVRLAHHVSEVSAGASGPVVRVRHRDENLVDRADAVVVAVPPRVATKIVPQLTDTPAGRSAQLGTSPIVNVHVVFDRKVTDLSFAAGVDSPVQWFFDRTASSGLARTHPAAQYLAVTVSAADDVIDVPSAEVQRRFVDALERLLPRTRRAGIVEAFVTRERHATFRQSAGCQSLRPGAVSGVDGVWLAGAWTDTGWPDTMEGAVRSGTSAAAAVLHTTSEPMRNLT